eukprot:2940563-Alexandrium_andersonii.AAC.1
MLCSKFSLAGNNRRYSRRPEPALAKRNQRGSKATVMANRPKVKSDHEVVAEDVVLHRGAKREVFEPK